MLSWITIDRKERMNSLRGRTVDELIHCLKPTAAGSDVRLGIAGIGQRGFSEARPVRRIARAARGCRRVRGSAPDFSAYRTPRAGVSV
jgi:enoyl-CoA hydratase/carnithine racemase